MIVMNKKALFLRFFLRWMAVLYMCFSLACIENKEDKHLNKKYEKNVLGSIAYREELTVSGTIDQIATQFIMEKGETYMFSLGFRPTTDNIAEFEQILRNDFNGEIEIFQDGKVHSIIKYHDFDSFVWSPGKDAYGPMYYLEVEHNDTNYSFRPKITAKEACAYSFYIQRVKKSFIKSVKNFFKLKMNDGGSHHTAEISKQGNEKTRIPAIMRRIDMDIEKKGRHIVIVCLHSVIQGEHNFIQEYSLFSDLMENDYDGTIKIYKNDSPYYIIRYDNTNVFEGGLYGWWGEHDAGKDGSREYDFYADEPGTYSFIPEVKSKQNFEFSLSIYYNHKRK